MSDPSDLRSLPLDELLNELQVRPRFGELVPSGASSAFHAVNPKAILLAPDELERIVSRFAALTTERDEAETRLRIGEGVYENAVWWREREKKRAMAAEARVDVLEEALRDLRGDLLRGNRYAPDLVENIDTALASVPAQEGDSHEQ